MSCGKTSLLELCPSESAMSVHASAKRLAQWPVGMLLIFLSMSISIRGLTIEQADRLAYLEEKVNLILNGTR